MLKLPGGLRVIERGRIAGELELIHHLLRAAVFALEQECQVDLELDHLRGLILVAAGSRQRALRTDRAPLRIPSS